MLRFRVTTLSLAVLAIATVSAAQQSGDRLQRS